MTLWRALLIAGVLAAATAIGILAVQPAERRATAPGQQAGTATAAVIRTTLASRQQVAGTLEPAGSFTLVSQQLTGTLSWLPAPGSVIRRGGVLYRVDGQPVRLLYGLQSAWRTLALGVTDGADVHQLDENLRALGYTAGRALAVSDHFDWATAVAIEQWQRAQGAPATGVLPLGSVAFLPGPVQTTAQQALSGSPVQPGTQLLDLNSTDLVVSVPLDPSLRQLVHVGDHVRIQLPEGQITTGTVSQIGAETAVSRGQASTGSGSPGGSGQAGGSSSAQGDTGSPTVPVTIALEHPGQARGLDLVPVEVQITDAVRPHVLAVPVQALLALAQGSDAVAVQSRGARTLIAVTPGIFDGDRVQVSSPQLRPGMRVEVPST